MWGTHTEIHRAHLQLSNNRSPFLPTKSNAHTESCGELSKRAGNLEISSVVTILETMFGKVSTLRPDRCFKPEQFQPQVHNVQCHKDHFLPELERIKSSGTENKSPNLIASHQDAASDFLTANHRL